MLLGHFGMPLARRLLWRIHISWFSHHKNMLKNCLAHLLNMLSDSSCLCLVQRCFRVGIRGKIVLMEESIEWFIEARAFSPPSDLIPPPPPPYCHAHTGRLIKRDSLLTEDGGGGVGGGSKSYDGEKAWFSVNHSIPSGWRCSALETRSVSVLEIGLLQFWEYREIYSCF